MRRVLPKKRPHRHHTGGYNGMSHYGPKAWATKNLGKARVGPNQNDRERNRRLRQMMNGQLTGIGAGYYLL